MKIRISTIKVKNYKGHVIRKVVDVIGNEFVLIDNMSNEHENAPAFMTEQDFTYASICDAMRFINGDKMTWTPEEAEILGDRYYNRFK